MSYLLTIPEVEPIITKIRQIATACGCGCSVTLLLDLLEKRVNAAHEAVSKASVVPRESDPYSERMLREEAAKLGYAEDSDDGG